MRSSNASAPCRFEWRPSRWVIGALVSLALLAPLSLWASDLPPAIAWPAAVLVAVGAALSALRHARRPAVAFVVPGEGAPTVDGTTVDDFRVEWRGPLAFLSWRDGAGQARRASLWPDTLSPATRRELRLALVARGAGRMTAPVSP